MPSIVKNVKYDDIENNPQLNSIIEKSLPSNYNFEIKRILTRIRQLNAQTVALQMPEGLQMFACIIADILIEFSFPFCIEKSNLEIEKNNKNNYTEQNKHLSVCIMADVTYGACCIDDHTARALNADLLVHFGHSCLIPINQMNSLATSSIASTNDNAVATPLSFLYVMVTIQFDTKHLIETMSANFPRGSRIALVSTIQFVASLPIIKRALEQYFRVVLPAKTRPLSPGEILGCTAPASLSSSSSSSKKLGKDDRHDTEKDNDVNHPVDLLVYVGDGRFHLESVMIGNPDLPAYQYDPYSKKLTREHYEHAEMLRNRDYAIQLARKTRKSHGTFALIKGTLGRQASDHVFQTLAEAFDRLEIDYVVLLLSEIYPSKLRLFEQHIDVFVQISCPRLSIDWGSQFSRPLLNSYEAAVVLDLVNWLPDGHYPTDFYAHDSLGNWTPNYKQSQQSKKQQPIKTSTVASSAASTEDGSCCQTGQEKIQDNNVAGQSRGCCSGGGVGRSDLF